MAPPLEDTGPGAAAFAEARGGHPKAGHTVVGGRRGTGGEGLQGLLLQTVSESTAADAAFSVKSVPGGILTAVGYGETCP